MCIRDSSDFFEVPPPKFKRLTLGSEVRLMGAYLVRCTGVDKDEAGNVVAVHANADLETRNGNPADGRKVDVYKRQGMGKLGCPLLGTLLKVGHLALFHQLIHDDKGDSDRPHPDAKRDDDGPPGELERLVCRAGPVGILVLVAAVTAAVGVAGVCVARPLILILHTMLLLQYFPFRQYRTILSADMACRSRRSGA